MENYRKDLLCVILVINLLVRTYGHVTTVSSGSTLEPNLAPSLLFNTSPSSMIRTDDVIGKMTLTHDTVTSVETILPTSAVPDNTSLNSIKLQAISTNILLPISSNLESELADDGHHTYEAPSSTVIGQTIASGLGLVGQPSDTLSESSQQFSTTSLFNSEIYQHTNISFAHTASQPPVAVLTNSLSFMTSELLVTSIVIGQMITSLPSLNGPTVIFPSIISKIESTALISVPEIAEQMMSSSTGLLSESDVTSSVIVDYTSNDYRDSLVDSVLTNIPISSSSVNDDDMSSLQPSSINYLSSISLEPTQSIKSTQTSIAAVSDSSSYIGSDSSVMSDSALISTSVYYPDPIESSLEVNSYSIVTETFDPMSSSVAIESSSVAIESSSVAIESSSVAIESSLSIIPTSTQSVSTASTSIPVNATVPTPEENKGGLSSGGKVALGICIPIIIIAILAVTGFLVYRRRHHAASWKLSDVVSYRPWSYSNASYYDDESSLIIPSLNK